jgi:hypothetical protein
MSGRIKLAALAAALSVVSVHGTASARNYFPAFPPAHQHQSYKAVNRSKAKIPSNAFGSIGDRTGTSHLAQPVFGWEGAYGYQPSARPPYDGYRRDRQLVGSGGGDPGDTSSDASGSGQ